MTILNIISKGWGLEERALDSEAGRRFPPMEQAHQAYVTGFLSGLFYAGKIDRVEMERIARAAFEERERQLHGGLS